MVLKYCFSSVLILFAVLVQASVTSDVQSDTKSLMTSNKPVRGLATGMWFGPRLGRRLKRNLKLDHANKEELNNLMDIIQDSPWVILATNDLVSEGKRHTVNFTPRLGRESGEETEEFKNGNDRWMQDMDYAFNSGDLMAQRSPPFAPRLGRRIGAGPIRYPAYL